MPRGKTLIAFHQRLKISFLLRILHLLLGAAVLFILREASRLTFIFSISRSEH